MPRVVRRWTCIAAVVWLVIAAPIHPALAAASPLSGRLDALISELAPVGTLVAACVHSAQSGDILYQRNSDVHLPPASNQKLITSTAALAELGQDYRFVTRVLSPASPANGILQADLYFVGRGDPTLLPDRLDNLAEQLARGGLREVHGDLVADDTWFDAERLGQDWSQQDLEFAFAAPVSALTVAPDADFNAGSVQVDIGPGATEGAPAVVGLTPATSAVEVRNSAVTGAASAARQLSATRPLGSAQILVGGTLPVDSRASRPLRSVPDPTLYAADVFRSALTRQGITVRGATRRGVSSAGSVELASTRSMALSELLQPWLKLSNNPVSEVVMKAMGRHDANDGSWRAGARVMARFLAAYGVDSSGLQLVDGSGLSTADLVAPDDLCRLLVAVQTEPWFATWYAALPIAGEPDRLVGGTLSQRMAGGPAAGNVHAKTGTLTTTSALSGYVTTAAGQRLAFSIIQSGVIGQPTPKLQDAIAELLAAWPDPV